MVFKKRILAWPEGLSLGAKNSAWLDPAMVRLAFAEPVSASIEPRAIAKLAITTPASAATAA